MNKIIILFFVLFSIQSCSIFSRGKKSADSGGSVTENSKRRYKLTDKAGEFIIYKENGLKPSDKTYISKREVLPFDDDSSKVLEQSVAISKVGTLNKKMKIMRPYKSQYAVWFDGKKYTTNMTLNESSRSLVVKMKSPEKQWNGRKSFNFPDSKAIYCFFTQVLECTAITGFFKKAFEKGRGQMNFYLIWDGFPYFQEQYLNIPDSIFTKAKLNYDGKNKNGERRFSLNFAGQVIFFLFDEKYNFIKKFWISQGLSMVLSEK